jgi:NADH dehydrogenase [ubiquinone] 1 alpha subcomplex assembly factor 7
MTPLARILARQIASDGPMRLSDYMAACLLHPEHGYYTTRTAFGASGDFTTAPEISQIFGEMIGAWLAQVWTDQGRPDPFLLTEIGPGRGTLMADALRIIDRLPAMRAAARIHLIEASPALRARQAAALPGVAPVWHDDLSTLPDGSLFLIANEFFDALPIRQFVRTGDAWAERLVGLTDGTLAFGLSPPRRIAALDTRLHDTVAGDVVEVCPALPAIASGIAKRIARRGGAALIVDYGSWGSLGDTFQAMRAHGFADPLAEPGQADLTAHVDFRALADVFAAGGAAVTGMTGQGVFLERLGITARAKALAQSLTGPAREAHIAAHRRLTHPQEMGRLFKAIACYPPGKPPPPGLDAAPDTA